MENDTLITQASNLILSAKRAVAFTGAGISTPSGIPDFRSPGSGLWSKYDPFEVASLSSFKHHPEKFYGWLQPLVETAKAARPNQAHICLAELEKAGRIQAVITQNIDNLHQRAGSENVIELHGSGQSALCLKCGKQFGEEWLPDKLEAGVYPTCDNCGGILKPNVVLFEEMLPADAWTKAQALCEQTDLILVVGSSLEVYPANMLPESGLRHGAKLIINTLSRTHLDNLADVVIHADLIDTIPAICETVLSK
jgi:NAD-dependent deacetylase